MTVTKRNDCSTIKLPTDLSVMKNFSSRGNYADCTKQLNAFCSKWFTAFDYGTLSCLGKVCQLCSMVTGIASSPLLKRLKIQLPDIQHFCHTDNYLFN